MLLRMVLLTSVLTMQFKLQKKVEKNCMMFFIAGSNLFSHRKLSVLQPLIDIIFISKH